MSLFRQTGITVVGGFSDGSMGSFQLGGFVTRPLPTGITTITYVYLFLVLINVFRALFSYSRWAFPRVEIDDKDSESSALPRLKCSRGPTCCLI